MNKAIGLHHPIYLEPDFVDEAVGYAKKRLMIVAAGIDELSPLERLALIVLKQNELFQANTEEIHS